MKYVEKTVGEDSAFKIAAAKGEIPAAIAKVLGDVDADFLAAVAETPASEKGCGKGLKFTVYATAPDVDSTQDVVQALEAAGSDPTQLLDEITAGTGQQVCT